MYSYTYSLFTSVFINISGGTYVFIYLIVYLPFIQPEFYEVCHTKKDYEEHGPSICRHNPVFGTMS